MSDSHSHAPGPLADASVRTARVSDTPAVGLVQATVWRETFAELLPAEALQQFEGPAFAHAWRRSLQDPPGPVHRLLVACAGAQVVGFAAIAPTEEPDTGELLVLGVHPDARRAGHGSRLLNAAADTLRAHDRTGMQAWVPDADERTRAFLATAGLEPDGAWRDRVVDPEGATLREVRLVGSLGS